MLKLDADECGTLLDTMVFTQELEKKAGFPSSHPKLVKLIEKLRVETARLEAEEANKNV